MPEIIRGDSSGVSQVPAARGSLEIWISYPDAACHCCMKRRMADRRFRDAKKVEVAMEGFPGVL